MTNLTHISKRLALIFLFFFSSLQAHEYYVSICDIEFNSESNTLEITLKLFTDDLENTLQQGKSRLYLGEDGESATADSLLESYLKRVFAI